MPEEEDKAKALQKGKNQNQPALLSATGNPDDSAQGPKGSPRNRLLWNACQHAVLTLNSKTPGCY